MNSFQPSSRWLPRTTIFPLHMTSVWPLSTTNPQDFSRTNHLFPDFPCFSLTHLDPANVNLKNCLSLGPLINVSCFLSLADKLFLLTGVADGEAETSCPKTQSFIWLHLQRLNRPCYFRELSFSRALICQQVSELVLRSEATLAMVTSISEVSHL